MSTINVLLGYYVYVLFYVIIPYFQDTSIVSVHTRIPTRINRASINPSFSRAVYMFVTVHLMINGNDSFFLL